MAGHTSRIFHCQSQECKLVLDIDDKKGTDAKEEKKEVKECLVSLFCLQPKCQLLPAFPSKAACFPASPVIESLTPPPDAYAIA
ncbi:MAG TPA: hypothetical protein VFR58_08815 [Flavisolibacter sp.]|nr:hypothetical protein [Flavisolibacter sp.]